MERTIKEVGQMIRQRRRELNWSLLDLSKRAGISKPYVSALENGRHVPSAPVANDLARVLGLSVEAITLPTSRSRRSVSSPVTRRSRSRIEMFQFINSFYAENGYMPSIREIRQALGVSSTSVVKYALNQMVEWGWISRTPDVARSIRLNEVDNPQVIAQGLARLREAIMQADPGCLEDGRFEEMMGSPQRVIEVAAAILQKVSTSY